MFDIKVFVASFDANLVKVEDAEKITREVLRAMSRDVLFALHQEEENPRVGDITFINRIMQAKLTPMNRKALALFFREFTGFLFDEEKGLFVGKNKGIYLKAKDKALKALEDPLFNFWSWADKEVEVARKPFKLADITKNVEKMLKKADEEGLARADVLKAILDGGIKLDEIVAIMDAAA